MKEKEAKKRQMEEERRKKEEEERRLKEEEKLKNRDGLQKKKASRATGKQNKGPTTVTVKSVVCPVCEEWPLLGFATNNGLPKCPKRTLCISAYMQCESLDSMFNNK